jgi:hypothetical protein
MESVLAALKDTPIPTILVIAGIVFLLLSVVGQLAGRITVPPERQRQAAIIGCLLVVVGVALHVAPPLKIPSKPPEYPTPPPPKPAPEPPSPQPPLTPGKAQSVHSISAPEPRLLPLGSQLCVASLHSWQPTGSVAHQTLVHKIR